MEQERATATALSPAIGVACGLRALAAVALRLLQLVSVGVGFAVTIATIDATCLCWRFAVTAFGGAVDATAVNVAVLLVLIASAAAFFCLTSHCLFGQNCSRRGS